MKPFPAKCMAQLGGSYLQKACGGFFSVIANRTFILIASAQQGSCRPQRVPAEIRFTLKRKALRERYPGGAWHQTRADLIALSTNSKQIIASKAGHNIQANEPQLVTRL